MAGVLLVTYTLKANQVAETETKGSTAVIIFPGYEAGVNAGYWRLTLVRTISYTIGSLGLNTFSVPCTTKVSSLKAPK